MDGTAPTTESPTGTTAGDAGTATAARSPAADSVLRDEIRALVREEIRRLAGAGSSGQGSPQATAEARPASGTGGTGGGGLPAQGPVQRSAQGAAQGPAQGTARGTAAPATTSSPPQPGAGQAARRVKLPLGTAALRAAERKIHERLARNLSELKAVLRETEAIAREMEALLGRTPQPGGSGPSSNARAGSAGAGGDSSGRRRASERGSSG